VSNCDMCGISTDRLSDVVVEGTMLNVCDKCKGYGNSVGVEKPKNSELDESRVPRKIYVEESVVFVVEGAGKIIKESRENMGLKQEQLAKMVGLKESMIHKIETSLIKPELSTAKKFERILGISIIEAYSDSSKGVPFNLDDGNLTVGDLIKFKKSD
jgi:putative transcription factor